MNLRQLSTETRGGLRVELAPFRPDDIDRVYWLCQDPEIQRWTTVPTPYHREDAQRFVTEYVPTAWREVDDGTFSAEPVGAELVWAVRVPGDGPTAGLWGSLGLKRLGQRRLEIGWWLGADVRGMGIMRASVAKVLAVAFDALGASEIWWYAMEGNEPSARVAQRTGFAFTGLTTLPMHGDKPVWGAVLRRGGRLMFGPGGARIPS